MARKGKRSGKSTSSIQKRSNRSSSSAGSLNSKSRNSLSSKCPTSYDDSENFTEKSTNYSTPMKTLYDAPKDEPDAVKQNYKLNQTITAWLQGGITTYSFIGVIICLIWHGIHSDIVSYLIIVSMMEMVGCFMLLQLIQSRSMGSSCIFLCYQYFLLFLLFSTFLQCSFDPNSWFLDKIFSLGGVCLVCSFVHFFLMIQSMELIGGSSKREDYSGKIILEGVEKRRKDLLAMITGLVNEICHDDKDVKINFMITDEIGRAKKMDGSEMKASVSRSREIITDQEGICLKTSSFTTANVGLPKEKRQRRVSRKSSRSESSNRELQKICSSKYNNCEKQEKMLSPRKVL